MLEITAVLFTLLSVWLTRKQNIWCWATGIVGIVCYYFIFQQDKSWGNMLLQIIFLIQSIYGCITWGKKDTNEVELSDNLMLLAGGGVLTLIFGFLYIFSNIFSAPMSLLDIITTALSIMGMYLIAVKKLESWFYWGAANIFYIIFFISTGHILSAILYTIFLINAYFGYKEWKSSIEVHMC